MLNKFGLAEARPMRGDLQIEFMIKTTPTQPEVVEMIEEWRGSHSTVWDDIGFEMRGEQKPHWLSSEVPKKEVTIDIERHNEELVDTEILLGTLNTLLPTIRNIYQAQ
jgi:hypothetical protein